MTKAHTEADARQALESIAGLAGIPASAVDKFIADAACGAFYRAEREFEYERWRPRCEYRLHRVALKAQALLRELDQLDGGARLRLGSHLMRSRVPGALETGDLADFEDLTNCDPAVAAAIQDVQAIENAAKATERPTNPKGGRKKRQSIFDPEFGVFSGFVFDLQYAISAHGGKTRFDKNMRTGSLVEILRTALPFLPDEIDAPIWLRDADSQSTCGADRVQTIKRQAEDLARTARDADELGWGFWSPFGGHE